MNKKDAKFEDHHRSQVDLKQNEMRQTDIYIPQAFGLKIIFALFFSN